MADLFPARVRGLQGIYPEAHRALVNWGLWSRDRAGIFPIDARPSVWDQFKADESEAWGEDDAEKMVAEAVHVKAERAETEPYEELDARDLDARINEFAALAEFVKDVLVTAYGARGYIPEHQYCRSAGCGQDAFCERLEAGLRFASRFV